MLKWLRNALTRWVVRRSRRNGVLRYFDGTRWKTGDPWRIYRALESDEEVNYEEWAPLVDRSAEPETTRVIEGLCRAFEVQRFDSETGLGLLDWEIIDLWGMLGDYLEALKKNSDPTLTSPPPTGSTPSGSPERPDSTAPTPPSRCTS